MKSKLIVSSILTIALCLSLIAGSTFALFTSESKVNVGVTSAKVKVSASFENDTMTKNFGDAYATDASVDANDPTKLVITNFAPKDSVIVGIKAANESSIAIKYRLSVTSTNDFGGALRITSSPIKLDTWNSASAGQPIGNDGMIYVTIEYLYEENTPLDNAGNAEISFTLDAVQANGVVQRVKNADELKSVLTSNNATDIHPITVIFEDNIVAEESLTVNGNVIIDTNGKSLSAATAFDVKHSFIMSDNSSITINSDNNTSIYTASLGLVQIPKNVSADVTINGGKYIGYNQDDSTSGAFIAIQDSSDRQNNILNIKLVGVSLMANGMSVLDSLGMANTDATVTIQRCTFTSDISAIICDGCQLTMEDTKFDTTDTPIKVFGTQNAIIERCEISVGKNAAASAAGVSVSENAKLEIKHCSITTPSGIPSYRVTDSNGQIISTSCTANSDTIIEIEHPHGTITIDNITYTKQ